VSFAPNQLIKQGAKLVTSWEDVVEELPTEIVPSCFRSRQLRARTRVLICGSTLAQEKNIFGLLGVDEAVHVDELVEKIGIDLLRSPGGRSVKWR